MPEFLFLLTKEEADQATDTLPDRATWGDYRKAIAQAALRKVAEWLKGNSNKHYLYSGRIITIWDAEKWDALMRESGLPQVEGYDCQR